MLKLQPRVQDVLDVVGAACDEMEVGLAPLGRSVNLTVFSKPDKQSLGDLFDSGIKTKADRAVSVLVSEGRLERENGSLLIGGTRIPIVIVQKEKHFLTKQIKARCPRGYEIEIYTMLKCKGYIWVDGGFLKKDATAEGPRFYRPKNEQDFFKWIGMPWCDPKLRKYGSVYARNEPDNKEPITSEEMRQWVKGCRWIGSDRGGEYHEFTGRVTQKPDDEMFCRVLAMIYQYGYDGEYLGRSWRYLDLDGMRYFSNNYRINETQLINRKAISRNAREWVKNPVRLRTLTMRDRTDL